MLHESIANMLQFSADPQTLDTAFQNFKQQNPDLKKIEIKLDTDEERQKPLANDRSHPNITTVMQDGVRLWQVTSVVGLQSKTVQIISEHDLSASDNIMTDRRIQSYYALTAIFIFIITVAYWIVGQNNWQRQAFKIQQSLHDRDDFANVVAHEIRSPITVLRGYLDLLGEDGINENTKRDYYHNMRVATDRLLGLVSAFLEVSRLHAGKVEFKMADTDLRELIVAVIDSHRPQATKKNLQLKYEPGDKPLVATVDKEWFSEIMTNVITNAIKYTEKGSVTVRATEIRGGVAVRVEDTGVGISAKNQHKLFKPFERIVEDGNLNNSGNGLGLWITKQLVELLNGEIKIESTRDIGTRVIMKFYDD